MLRFYHRHVLPAAGRYVLLYYMSVSDVVDKKSCKCNDASAWLVFRRFQLISRTSIYSFST